MPGVIRILEKIANPSKLLNNQYVLLNILNIQNVSNKVESIVDLCTIVSFTNCEKKSIVTDLFKLNTAHMNRLSRDRPTHVFLPRYIISWHSI